MKENPQPADQIFTLIAARMDTYLTVNNLW